MMWYVSVGPIFGGFVYQLTGGKEIPFLVLAVSTCLVAAAQLFFRLCSVQDTSYEVSKSVLLNSRRSSYTLASLQPVEVELYTTLRRKSTIFTLLKDPYIILASLTLMLGNMSIGVLETSLPTWLLTNLCAAEWMLGISKFHSHLVVMSFHAAR